MKGLFNSLFRKSNTAIKDMNTWDIGLLKLGCIFAGLLLAKLVPDVLAAPVWLYVVLVLVTMLPVVLRFLPRFAAVR